MCIAKGYILYTKNEELWNTVIEELNVSCVIEDKVLLVALKPTLGIFCTLNKTFML